MKRRTLFILILSLTGPVGGAENDYLATLIQESREKKLAADPYWEKLLHYKRGFISPRRKSDIDGPHFFLSPRGRVEAQAELESTLASFFEPASASPEIQHPQCRFPARFAWLDENLKFDERLSRQTCPRFESWRARLNPESASLIFASYYMNNPASMYGHTFVRLGRATEEPQPLLEYTVNYAAETTTDNGLFFAVLGLTGGFRGIFSTHPYYMKVQQYNNLESRDLWEYPLALTPAQVNRMVQHLWELGQTSMAYYFFHKNCSYQLLPLLEVADPRLTLKDRFSVRAIPLDTLRAVMDQPGAVTGWTLRPSHLRQMRAEQALLRREEIVLIEQWIDRRDPAALGRVETLPEDRRWLVLDTAFDYLRYRTGFARNQPEAVREKEKEILTLRQALPAQYAKRAPLKIETPPPPHAGHGTGRTHIGAGVTRADAVFAEAGLRFALHDFEADQSGFIPGSLLEMMGLKVRYEGERGKFYLEDFTAVNVRSLTPWERWVHKPSWGVKIFGGALHDLPKEPENSQAVSLSGGSGVTLRVPKMKDALVYSMIEAEASGGSTFRDGYRAGLGGSAGLLIGFHPRFRTHARVSVIQFQAGDTGSVNRWSVVPAFQLTKSLELRGVFARDNRYREQMASINYYF